MEKMKVGVAAQDRGAGGLELLASVIGVGGDAVADVGVHAFVVLDRLSNRDC